MSCSRPPTSPAQMPIDSSITLTGGEACHRERSDQGAIGAVARGGERCRVERHQAIAETLDRIDQRCRALGRAAPDQAQAAGGHVDAAGQQVGFAGEHRLDQPDAGAALQAVDRQDEFVRAVGMGGDEAGEVAALGWFGARCAKGWIEDPLRVVAAEAERLDGLVGRGAAGAAEAAPGGGGWPQWRQAAGCPTLPRAGEDRAHPPSPARRGRVGEGATLNARSPAASPPCRGRRAMPTASDPTARASAAPHRRRSARRRSRGTPAPASPGAPSGRSADAATDAPRSGAPSRSVSVTSGRPAASVRAATVQPSAASRCSRSSTAS